MPPPRISADTLHQMMLDTRADISRMQRQLDANSQVAADTGLVVERISNKLDRALTLEAAVVEMRSELDQTKGMGILGAILLGALEGVLGIITFFRH